VPARSRGDLVDDGKSVRLAGPCPAGDDGQTLWPKGMLQGRLLLRGEAAGLSDSLDHVRVENALATPCQPSGCRQGLLLFLSDGCDGVADLALLVAQQQEIVPAQRAGDDGLDRLRTCRSGQPFRATPEISFCHIRLRAQ
jgi:hypothetical protein